MTTILRTVDPLELLKNDSFLMRLAKDLVAADLDEAEIEETHDDRAPTKGAVPGVSLSQTRDHDVLRRRLVELTLKLEEPQRTTLLTWYFKQGGPVVVARDLHSSVEVVRARLHRSLEKLREDLDREHGEREAWRKTLAVFVREARAPPALSATDSAGSRPFSIAPWILRGLVIPAGVVLSILIAGLVLLRARGALDPLLMYLPFPRSAGLLPEPPAPSRVVELKVRAVFARDQSPARGVVLSLSRLGELDIAYLLAVTRAADENGACTFGNLLEGKYVLMADRGGYAQTELASGDSKEIVLTIPPGAILQGKVIDPEGAAIAGAQIWLSYEGTRQFGEIVARTDPDGGFELSSVSGGRYVGARAESCAPSLLRWLPQMTSDLDMELKLRGKGGAVSGIAFDPEGKPASSAVMLVGHARGSRTLPPAGEAHDLEANEIVARTDRHGRFEIGGLEPGESTIVGWSRGCAPRVTKVFITPGASQFVEIYFSKGATVEGVVFDDDGTRVQDATIWVRSITSYFAPRTRSSINGEYRLTEIAPGTVEVIASHPELGWKKTELLIFSGETLQWDAVFCGSSRIAGRVVGPDGKPLSGFPVTIEQWGRSKDTSSSITDREGKFQFHFCPPGRYTVQVGFPLTPSDYAKCRFEVVPSPHRILLQVDPNCEPSSYLEGKVVGPLLPVGDAIVSPIKEDDTFPEALTDPTYGRFRAGPLPPGKYRLSVRRTAFAPSTTTDVFDLAAHEVRDVGEIVLRRAGSFRLDLVGDKDEYFEDLTVTIAAAESGVEEELKLDRATAYRANLAPGDYFVRVQGLHCAACVEPFHVDSDRTTSLNVPLQGGVETMIRIRPLLQFRNKSSDVTVRLLDSNGRIVATPDARDDFWFRESDHGDLLPSTDRTQIDLWFWRLGLLPGHYQIVVQDRSTHEELLRQEIDVSSDSRNLFDLMLRHP